MQDYENRISLMPYILLMNATLLFAPGKPATKMQ
jgi:hypothetical protein